MQGAVAFGVVQGTPSDPKVGYLTDIIPATPELLAVTGPIPPVEVFRFAAGCAENGCKHFQNCNCQLIERIVTLLPPTVDQLPACEIRPQCRWWLQSGKAACLRCPQVVTQNYQPTEAMRQAAEPKSVA